MRIRVLPLLLVVGVIAGCGGGKAEPQAIPDPPAAPQPASARDLAGRTFVSTSAEGHELVTGTRVTLKFSADTLGVQAGCNSISGKYKTEPGHLEFTPGPSTLIGCQPDLMDQDEWISDFLASAPAIDIEDDTLEITGADGVAISLEDSAGKVPTS